MFYEAGGVFIPHGLWANDGKPPRGTYSLNNCMLYNVWQGQVWLYLMDYL